MFQNYMNECCRDLKKGNMVIVFYDYQLKYLKEKFKHGLIIKYKEATSWWEVRLHIPKDYGE